MSKHSVFEELKKRRVVQVAAIYGAVAWGVTEVIVTVVSQLFLPQWLATLAVIGFVVGFPIAMFLAWTFDITTEGIERTPVSSRRARTSVAASLVLLVVATGALFLLIRPSLAPTEALPPAASGVHSTLAVLPFTVDQADDHYLGSGLSDDLRDRLSELDGLSVKARSSSIAVAEMPADVASKQLGVALIIEGNLRQTATGTKISVQLIDGLRGLTRWSKNYQLGQRDLLGIEQDIAQNIARELFPGKQVTLAAATTRSGGAHELMLLARDYEQQVRANPTVDEAMLNESITLYRQVTELEPDSALANSRLAGALLYLGDIAAAEAPIFRALNLNPNLSEVQTTLGLFRLARGETGALAALKRAVELNPNNADALGAYAYLSWMQGDISGAEELYRQALELDPLSLERHAALGEFLGKNGRIDELLAIATRVEQLFDDALAYRLIGDLLEYTGRLDETIAWTLRAQQLEPNNPDHIERLADLYAQIGDQATALKLQPQPGFGLLYRMRRYQDVIDSGELLMIEHPEDLLVRYSLAFAYNAEGQFDQAVRLLQLSGLPESAMSETRRAIDLEAFVTLVNAVQGEGEISLAREMTDWWLTRPRANSIDWWASVLDACAHSVSGQTDKALAAFERVKQSPRIPWASAIQDMPCFNDLVNEQRYQAVLDHVSSRRTEARQRLPETLARYRVPLLPKPETAD